MNRPDRGGSAYDSEAGFRFVLVVLVVLVAFVVPLVAVDGLRALVDPAFGRLAAGVSRTLPVFVVRFVPAARFDGPVAGDALVPRGGGAFLPPMGSASPMALTAALAASPTVPTTFPAVRPAVFPTVLTTLPG